MKLRTYALIIAAGCLSTAAMAKQEWQICNLTAGAVFPSSAELRDVFGSTWTGFGISPVGKDLANRWGLATDISLVYGKSDNNRLLLIPFTAGIGRVFESKDATDWVPYVAVRGGGYYMDYAITRPSNSVRYKESTFGLNGNAEVGLIFKKNFRFLARYDVYSRSNDFNFDGLTLGVSWTISR